jgi:hypothetical protein
MLKFPVFALDVHSQEKRNSPANFASLMVQTTPLTRGGGGWGRRSARVSSVVVSELVGECLAQGHSVRKLFLEGKNMIPKKTSDPQLASYEYSPPFKTFTRQICKNLPVATHQKKGEMAQKGLKWTC